jgi:hypothetical protein
MFAMRNAFGRGGAVPNGFPIDTLVVSGNYDGNEARLTARNGAARQVLLIPVSASLGWTLALPFQWSIEDTRIELLVSWLWLACLTIPIAYWGRRAANISDRRVNGPLSASLLVASAVLITGLLLVPRAFGLPTAPIRDWLAVSSGIVAGCALAFRREFRSEAGRRNFFSGVTTPS